MEHQKLLRKHGYQETLDDLKQAVEKNYQIVCHILNDVDDIFENVQHNNSVMDSRVKPTPLDMDKVKSTIKQIGNDIKVQKYKTSSSFSNLIINVLFLQF